MATHTHDLPLAFWQNNLEELDGEIARSEEADPLRPFGEACRAEFASINARL